MSKEQETIHTANTQQKIHFLKWILVEVFKGCSQLDAIFKAGFLNLGLSQIQGFLTPQTYVWPSSWEGLVIRWAGFGVLGPEGIETVQLLCYKTL